MQSNVVFTSTPLPEAIRMCFDIMKDDLRAEIKAALKQEVEEKLLSPEAARKVFEPAISRSTLDKYMREGRIKRREIGGRVFILQSELIEAVKEIKRYQR